jgi:glycosyltransferase involved in cell wall biosynthesis
MKIAVYHNLPSGGAKRALYEWLRRLADDHVLDVYTLSTADHAFCDVRPFVRRHVTLPFTPRPAFTSPWGRFNRWQRWRDLGTLTRIGRRIARVINDGGYDVAFVNPCEYTFLPALLQFLTVPSVYYLHEPFGPTFVRHFERPYLKPESGWRALSRKVDPFYQLYTRRLERDRRKSLHRTTRLLANSQFTQEEMCRAYDHQAPVCPYGVNTEDFYPLAGVAKNGNVLSVGALTPRKGFDFLVESLAHIPAARRPTLTLACNAVDPQEHAYVEALAQRHGVKVDVREQLDTDTLRIAYNRASLCVYAPIAEPFGLVPLEAMACGTPVVGVREGGVRESVVDGTTGILVERNAVSFAQAVRLLLDDRALAEQYGVQGRRLVLERWTWNASTRRLAVQLEEVMK